MNNFQIFWHQFVIGGYENVLLGLKNTTLISIFGLCIGFTLGCVITTIKLIPSNSPIVAFFKKICDAYVMIFRGTPIIVQLLLMHFGLFPAIGLYLSDLLETIIIFGLNSTAYMAEMLRSGIGAVDKGQMEAGRSLGFGFTQTMIRIILPQAIKNILPTLGNEFVALIKETSVVSMIGVMDLTRSFKAIGDSTYEYFIPFIMLALVYFILVVIISQLVKLMERRLAKNER